MLTVYRQFPSSHRGASWPLTSYFTVGSFFLLCFLYFWQFRCVLGAANAIFSGDEWTLLATMARHADRLSFAWLLEPHNEHRIVTVKLLYWLLGKAGCLNGQLLVILNYLVFGSELAVCYWVCRRSCPALPAWMLLLSLGALTSPFIYENHLTGMQINFHFTVIGSLLAAAALFAPEQEPRQLTLGLLALCLAAYSNAAGLAASCSLLVLYAVSKLSPGHKPPAGQSGTRELLKVVLVLGCGAAIVAVWFVDYGRLPNTGLVSLLFDRRFCQLFLNLVALGFGFEQFSSLLGAIVFGIVFGPLVFVICWRRGRWPENIWRLLALSVVSLSWLGSIALGRAAFPDIAIFSKGSRYAELAALLLPLAICWWTELARSLGLPKTLLPCVVLAVGACGWWSNWDYGIYDYLAKARSAELACACRYLAQEPLADCLAGFSQERPRYWAKTASLFGSACVSAAD